MLYNRSFCITFYRLGSLSGHPRLDLLHCARHDGQILRPTRRHDHVVFDAHAAKSPEAAKNLLVDEFRLRLVLQRLIQKLRDYHAINYLEQAVVIRLSYMIDKIDTGLDGYQHSFG